MELHWVRLNLSLRHAFVTATNRRLDKQTLWVRVQSKGYEGWGEAVPTSTYGQNLESAEDALRRARIIVADMPADDPAVVVDRLLTQLDDQRATVAAIDAAMHDWIGKSCGRPVIEWLGLDPGRAPLTSVTLGIASPDEMDRKLSELSEFPIFKIKIGTSDEADTLALVRSRAPSKRIRVDANTAWPANEAGYRLRRVADYRIELVEQPVLPDDLATLRRLKEARICPIVADESCVRPADVHRVADCVDGINIKLSKCGGIVEARRMIELARSYGLRVMLGCMIESSLGIAAAAQLAPLADWIDLDGHLLLASDPFTGLGGAAGVLSIGTGPGLGVRPS